MLDHIAHRAVRNDEQCLDHITHCTVRNDDPWYVIPARSRNPGGLIEFALQAPGFRVTSRIALSGMTNNFRITSRIARSGMTAVGRRNHAPGAVRNDDQSYATTSKPAH